MTGRKSRGPRLSFTNASVKLSAFPGCFGISRLTLGSSRFVNLTRDIRPTPEAGGPRPKDRMRDGVSRSVGGIRYLRKRAGDRPPGGLFSIVHAAGVCIAITNCRNLLRNTFEFSAARLRCETHSFTGTAPVRAPDGSQALQGRRFDADLIRFGIDCCERRICICGALAGFNVVVDLPAVDFYISTF